MFFQLPSPLGLSFTAQHSVCTVLETLGLGCICGHRTDIAAHARVYGEAGAGLPWALKAGTVKLKTTVGTACTWVCIASI